MKLNPALLAIVFVAGCASLPEPNFAPDEPSLRVVTYNINWGGPQPEQVARFLSESDADLICLQETHRQWESFLRSQLSASYPYSSFHSSGGAGGIAFMSKCRLSNVRLLKAEAGWFPALIADVDTEIGPIQVLNVHLKPPVSDTGSATLSAYCESPEVHRRELASFLEAAETDRPLIIAGDFNENERRDALKDLLSQGFTNALSRYDRRSSTWSWKVFPGIMLRNRYDHIIFSRHLHCVGAQVVDVRASDHRPVMAVLIEDKYPAEPPLSPSE
jgi:endonuclease/exonuclease/phosphatase family metal-dependent hydrolase